MTDFNSFSCKNVNQINYNMQNNGNQISVQLNKNFKLFVEDILIILTLSAL